MQERDTPAWVMECVRRIGMIESKMEQLRCKDCKWMKRSGVGYRCWSPHAGFRRRTWTRRGQFAGKCFVYKDK